MLYKNILTFLIKCIRIQKAKNNPLRNYINIFKESFIVFVVEYLMLSTQVFTTIALKHKYDLDTVGQYVMLLTISQLAIVGISQPFSSIIRRDLSPKNQTETSNYISNVNYSCSIDNAFFS
jgi:hypothetical protein